MKVSPHHPHSLPNTHHRRIELQSPADLTFLQAILSKAAQDKLDLHFPRSALQRPAQPATFISLDGRQQDTSQTQQPQLQPQIEEDDPLRARVHALVSAFLERTWSSAAHSISINGLDATSILPVTQTHASAISQEPPGEREGTDFTYSSYDSRLQTQLASLYGDLETLTAQVSKLRREAPQRGAEAYAKTLREQIQVDEEEDTQSQDSRQKQAQRQDNALNLTQQREGYYQDIESTYTNSLAELSRLAGVSGHPGQGNAKGTSLTETVGKVQRARTVAMEFD